LGHEREIGEAVRLIDVPAFSSGYSNIFDLATHRISVSEAEARLADLYNACRRHHGLVFDTYVSKLAADRQLKTKIKSLIGNFVQCNVTADDELVIRAIAKKFGLIYAGGQIATELGLTGWNHDELLKAISGTFLGAKSHLPDPSDTLKRGLRALRQGLRSLPKKKGVDHKSFGTIMGYELSSTDKTAFVILKHKFNELFETREQAERVTQFLMERNHLRLRAITQGSRPEPKQQIIWPDQKRRRSYQINLPRQDWLGALSLKAPVQRPTE
jgi:hypothetical protein